MEYLKAFKALLKDSQDREQFLAEVPYRRSVPILKAAPEGLTAPGSREAWFTMTDAGVDREGDLILSSGVDVEQFREYGSILWGHRADEPRFVLGSPAEVVKEETRILVRANFLSEDANPDAERVLRMIQSGGVRAMSVGVMIREYSEAKDRDGWMPLNITRSELIETSVTPVPVNPRAVLLAAGESDSDKAATADLLTEATDTESELAASVLVTGLSEDSIKSLVKETVDQLLGQRTYSLPSRTSGDSALDALNHFARLAAQNTER